MECLDHEVLAGFCILGQTEGNQEAPNSQDLSEATGSPGLNAWPGTYRTLGQHALYETLRDAGRT